MFAACDSGGSSAEVDNEFNLNIEPTGSSASAVANVESARKAVNGFSFFFDAEHPETGEQAFGIYFNDGQSFSADGATQGLFGFVARLSTRPSTGTYTFASGNTGVQSSQFVGFLYEDFSNIQSSPFYVIESGTLTLDTSTDERVAGSIDATGTSFTFANGSLEQETVNITGSFTAKSVDVFAGFGTPGV